MKVYCYCQIILLRATEIMELTSDELNTISKILVAVTVIVLLQALLARKRRTKKKKSDDIRDTKCVLPAEPNTYEKHRFEEHRPSSFPDEKTEKEPEKLDQVPAIITQNVTDEDEITQETEGKLENGKDFGDIQEKKLRQRNTFLSIDPRSTRYSTISSDSGFAEERETETTRLEENRPSSIPEEKMEKESEKLDQVPAITTQNVTGEDEITQETEGKLEEYCNNTGSVFSRDRSVRVESFYGDKNPRKGGNEASAPDTTDVPNSKRFATEFSDSQTIGSSGGTLATGGCRVLIPRNALDATCQIELQCVYEKHIFQDQERTVITPTVSLEPSNLKLSKSVAVFLPTYFQPVGKADLCSILIQTKKTADGIWENVIEVKTWFSGRIAFHVDHFSLYRGLMKKVFGNRMIKSLCYVGFIRRFNLNVNPEKHVLIMCFCPNLPHARQELMADMIKADYERVIESESITIRHEQHLEVKITSSHPEVKVMTSPRTIASSQLWYANSVKKEVFELSRLIDDAPEQVKLSYSINVSSDRENRRLNIREGVGYFYWRDTDHQLSPCTGDTYNISAERIENLTFKN